MLPLHRFAVGTRPLGPRPRSLSTPRPVEKPEEWLDPTARPLGREKSRSTDEPLRKHGRVGHEQAAHASFMKAGLRQYLARMMRATIAEDGGDAGNDDQILEPVRVALGGQQATEAGHEKELAQIGTTAHPRLAAGIESEHDGDQPFERRRRSRYPLPAGPRSMRADRCAPPL